MSDHGDYDEIAAVQRDYEAEYGPEVAEEQAEPLTADPIGQLCTELGEWHDRLSLALSVNSPTLLAGTASRIRDRIAELLADWPQLVADIYGTPNPDADTPPLPRREPPEANR